VFTAFISEEIFLSLWNYQDGENCDNIMYSSAVHFFAGVSRRHGIPKGKRFMVLTGRFF